MATTLPQDREREPGRNLLRQYPVERLLAAETAKTLGYPVPMDYANILRKDLKKSP